MPPWPAKTPITGHGFTLYHLPFNFSDASWQDGEIVPELPDIVVYIEALESRIVNQTLERVRVASPFLLRTAIPPLQAGEGKSVREVRRVGKRIAFGLQDDLWLVLHLRIAGRLHSLLSKLADAPRGEHGSPRTRSRIRRQSKDSFSLSPKGAREANSIRSPRGTIWLAPKRLRSRSISAPQAGGSQVGPSRIKRNVDKFAQHAPLLPND